MRLLLAAHPTVGHTSALRAIGARLLEAGHAVGFAMIRARLPFAERWPAPIRAGLALADTLERDGFELLPLRPALATLWHSARLPSRTGYDELGTAINLFTSGLTPQARAIAAHAARFRAQAILGDYLMPAALLGAEVARLPYLALYHSALPFPVEGAAPFGSRLPLSARGTRAWADAERSLQTLSTTFDERIGAAARELGVRSSRRYPLTAPISRDLNLLATVPELEPGLAPLDAPVVMIGPCLPRPKAAGDADHPSLHVLPQEGLRVYVSLGTVFNGKPEVFDRILDGLEACGAHVVVSAGASHRHLTSRPRPRTHVFPFVPQVALLPRVDLVITHGGNNTVQECLAAGRAMVVLPFGGDQLENATRVERLGVGAALDAATFTPIMLRDAVLRVRTGGVERAAEIGKALAGVDGAARGATEILRLLEAR